MRLKTFVINPIDQQITLVEPGGQETTLPAQPIYELLRVITEVPERGRCLLAYAREQNTKDILNGLVEGMS